ncbi:MAG: EAL domain-containing protein, partial [Cyanobacteria bacterium P01_E01_bin.35]
LIAENLAIKLKKLKYNVTNIVSSGKAAIKSIQKHRPDLILMDIAIKGEIDGVETAKIIRESHNLAIIFLTAYADDKTLERACYIGCYGYILKPYKDRELHATIKMAIQKHQEQIAIQKSLTEVSELLGQYSAEKSHIYEDSLTKLPNKLMLQELFNYLLLGIKSSSKSKANSDKSELNKKLISVIYIKLDRFERILASLGEERSDLLIKALSQRLKANTNDQIYECVPLRLDHSEFCILQSGLEHRQTASDYAQIIIEQLRLPFTIEAKNYFLTASLGISYYPFDHQQIERLLEQSKQAMVYAQDQGGNRFKLYTSAFRITASNHNNDLALEGDLHQAVEQNRLELYYQPKVNLSTGKIDSAEALIRWNHPQLGLILPNKIIPLAEACGLMDQIGAWILEQACRQTKIWHQVGFDFLRIAVNLSGYQFKQSDLFHKLTQLFFELNLDAKYIELELTEQILIENIQANIQKLNLIKKLGIKISLDDFGTGYSSLGYLHQFPFDVLKIDRCFITNIDQNQKNAVITKSVIEMAHQLGLVVVGEGVETQAELDFLVKNKCDEVQGYLFARPMPIRDFEKLLISNKCYLTATA